jgi:pimeloyl-ACP methyl ester carboxylesterase
MSICTPFKFLAALLAASLLAATPATADDTMRGTSTNDTWMGFMVLSGGKGYAPSPLGAVHYRDIGPRDYEHPIMILHQSPMSMIQFAEVQNALADMGVRAITVDTPGYGMSDLPPHQPTIEEYGANLVHVMDHLGIDKVLIAGHHTGAQIAATFAANFPDRVTGVILHGAALFNEEELAKYQAGIGNRPGTGRTPEPDGSHFVRRFGFPPAEPGRQEIQDAKTWLSITSYIQGPDIGHYAAFHYNMMPDFMAIKAPGMIMTDLKDDVHYIDVRAAELRPDFKYVEFSEGNILEMMAQPKKWAAIAKEFADEIKQEQRASVD